MMHLAMPLHPGAHLQQLVSLHRFRVIMRQQQSVARRVSETAHLSLPQERKCFQQLVKRSLQRSTGPHRVFQKVF